MVWYVTAFDLLEFIVGGEDGAREGTFILIGFWVFPFLFQKKEMVFNNLCDKTICLFNSALKMLKDNLMVTQSPPTLSL